MKRTWRIPDIESALKERFGNIAILMIDDMDFFRSYDKRFDGYWFAIHQNSTHRNIRGIIVEGMDYEDFHIECAPDCAVIETNLASTLLAY